MLGIMILGFAAAAVDYFHFRPARRFQAVVENIRSRGGEVGIGPRSYSSASGLLKRVLSLPWIRSMLSSSEQVFSVRLPKNCDGNDLASLDVLYECRQLIIESDELSDADLAVIPELPRLDNFWLKVDRATSAGIGAALKHCPKLEAVHFSGRAIDDELVVSLLLDARFRFVFLTESAVGNRAARAILTGPARPTFGVAKCSVSDDCFRDLDPAAVNIAAVDFSDTAISDAGAAFLLSCPRIEVLGLEGIPLGARSLAALRTNRHLERLDVNRFPGDISKVIEAVVACPRLERLTLDDNALTVDDVMILLCRSNKEGVISISVERTGVTRDIIEEAEQRCWTELEMPPDENVHFGGLWP